MSLAVEQDLEPVFNLAEEAIGIVHDASLVGRQMPTCSSWWIACRVFALADHRIFPAVEHLEELDDELDITDSPVARLDLELGPARRDGSLLDPPLQGLDLRDLAGAQIAAVDERGDRLEKVRPRSRSPATGRHLIRACRSQVRPRVT